MVGKSVSIGVNGTSMPAYLTCPEPSSGAHPAVIIIPEVFGVNAEMRRITDLVASAGYCGLAINVFHRVDPNFSEPYTDEGMQKGVAAALQVTRETIRADIAAAINWLSAQEFVKKGHIATWGFCMGGSLAFLSSTLPGLRGAVSFYGSQIGKPFRNGEPEALADVQDVACPLLLIFGGNDQSAPPETIEHIRTALLGARKDFQMQVYPGVGHAFFRHGSPEALAQQHNASDEAQAQAVADAWDLTRAFFARIFGSSGDGSIARHVTASSNKRT